MAETIPEYVGRRIRLHRKISGLTMEELAQRVHKSKASISKYESGQIAVDIATLFDIARALDVEVGKLINYTPPGAQKPTAVSHNLFDRAQRLYLYHMSRRRAIHLSVIHLGPEDEKGVTATMYYKVNAPDSLEQCECIYHGHMYSHATVLSFIFRNYHNPTENILINFSIPACGTNVLLGLISGLGAATIQPVARKVALSTEPVANNDQLCERLALSPESLRELKNSHTLTVPNGED